MVTLTPKAAAQVKARLAKENKPAGCLRLRVTPGGCSGLNYEFAFLDQPPTGDEVSETDGARLAVEPLSLFYLNGAVVDYFSSMMRSGFEVKNPNAASTCNCGTSFTT
jgi:iron-sulfur cluster assembly accessory protein